MRKLLLLYVILGLCTIVALSSCGPKAEQYSTVSSEIKAPKLIQYQYHYITGECSFTVYVIEGHKYMTTYYSNGINTLHMESCSCLNPINDTVDSH